MRMKWPQVPSRVLELSSKYTPLVEPVEDGGLFLDLSGCKPLPEVIKNIAIKAYTETGNFVEIGAAGSKLLACSAVTSKILIPGEKKQKLFHYIKNKQFSVTVVLPGREKEFIASILLEDFYVLKSEEVKKLKRMGFKTVGELICIPPSKLVPVLGKNIYQLLDQSRGMDNSPVLGLYPPVDITYPLPLEGDILDFMMIKNEIKKAGKVLEAILEKKHSGCGCLQLYIFTEKGWVKTRRKLTSSCYQAGEITNILYILLEQLEIAEPIKEVYITLSEIALLSWVEQDLFVSPEIYNPDKKSKLADVLKNIDYKFPGKLVQGQKIERREQILSFWDPWRYSPYSC